MPCRYPASAPMVMPMHSVTSVAKPPTAMVALPPGDDAREDVAAQVIAAADQAVFTGALMGGATISKGSTG